MVIMMAIAQLAASPSRLPGLAATGTSGRALGDGEIEYSSVLLTNSRRRARLWSKRDSRADWTAGYIT